MSHLHVRLYYPTQQRRAGLEFIGVRKTYPNGFNAIHGVETSVADGEFIVIVGPSGCGKSTLLRMVAGLERVTEGEIRIGERRVNELEPADRNIAMVFQNYALYPHMSVFDNMAYGLRNRRTPKDEIERRVAEASRILQWTACSTGAPISCPAASGNVWRWAAPSCASPRSFSSTNPSPISTQSCGCR